MIKHPIGKWKMNKTAVPMGGSFLIHSHIDFCSLCTELCSLGPAVFAQRWRGRRTFCGVHLGVTIAFGLFWSNFSFCVFFLFSYGFSKDFSFFLGVPHFRASASLLSKSDESAGRNKAESDLLERAGLVGNFGLHGCGSNCRNQYVKHPMDPKKYLALGPLAMLLHKP